jgi:Holliday junction resolvase
MSTKRKGKNNERYAKNLLRFLGYSVISPNAVRFGREDFFEEFDIIAVHPERQTLFIQVKTNGAPGINAFTENVQEYVNYDHARSEYWCRYDRDGWRILEVEDGEYTTLLDERDESTNVGQYILENYLDAIEKYEPETSVFKKPDPDTVEAKDDF